jgi:hypothetical protein
MIIFVKNTTMEKTAVYKLIKRQQDILANFKLNTKQQEQLAQLYSECFDLQKQQITDAYDNGKYITSGKEFGGEQYYNETFNK